MKLTKERKQALEEIYQTLFNDEKIQKMKLVPMHRGSNCYYHSFKVAKLAINHALNHKNVDLEVVLIGAILHDYYLYDWRVEKDKKMHHLSRHPYLAAEYAKRDFEISERVAKIIKSHMWPVNIKEFPNSKEARILSIADKMVATSEMMTSKRYKMKNEKKYLKHISTLFDD